MSRLCTAPSHPPHTHTPARNTVRATVVGWDGTARHPCSTVPNDHCSYWLCSLAWLCSSCRLYCTWHSQTNHPACNPPMCPPPPPPHPTTVPPTAVKSSCKLLQSEGPPTTGLIRSYLCLCACPTSGVLDASVTCNLLLLLFHWWDVWLCSVSLLLDHSCDESPLAGEEHPLCCRHTLLTQPPFPKDKKQYFPRHSSPAPIFTCSSLWLCSFFQARKLTFLSNLCSWCFN